MTQEIVISGGENAQQVVDWDPNSGAQLPAYLADALGDLGSNIPDRQNVPSLSYEGKTWQIVKDGNKHKLQATNSDGDLVPVPIMRVVVLNFNADRGRSYYEGAYDPSKTSAPKCWSRDGKTPDDSIPAADKQSAACNGCPQSVKGSKVADGKEMVACASHRMIAVVPGFEIDGDPLRLKIAVTSDYDKEIVEHGWFAFRQYVDFLKSRGISHTGLVVTKIKFDVTTQYPKLLFAMDRILTPTELGLMKAQLANPKVTELLAEKWTAAGSAGTPTDNSDIRPHGLEGAYADGWVAHPDAAGYSYKGNDVLTNDELAARYPAPEPKPAPPTPAAPAAPAAPIEKMSPEKTPRDKALEDGWVQHPDSPPHGYKGADVLEWSAIEAKYAAQPAAPAVPAAPAIPAAPEPEPDAPQKTPRELALEDGWVQHPDSPPHGYKGTDVLDWAAIEARYAGNAPAPATASATTTAGSAQTAEPTASPTDAGGVVNDPALAALLDQWTTG